MPPLGLLAGLTAACDAEVTLEGVVTAEAGRVGVAMAVLDGAPGVADCGFEDVIAARPVIPDGAPGVANFGLEEVIFAAARSAGAVLAPPTAAAEGTAAAPSPTQLPGTPSAVATAAAAAAAALLSATALEAALRGCFKGGVALLLPALLGPAPASGV